MGRDQWHLTASVETPTDLSGRQLDLQGDIFLSQADGDVMDTGRPLEQDRDRAEVAVRPVVSLMGLVPGDAGDVLTGESPEQGPASTFAIEDQGLRRITGVRPRQVRHDILPDRGARFRIEWLVDARQRLAAEGVDPVSDGARQTRCLTGDEVFGQRVLAPGTDLDMTVKRQVTATESAFRPPPSVRPAPSATDGPYPVIRRSA